MRIAELINQFYIFSPEKRKFPRFPLRLPTEYSLMGSRISSMGYTINICEGGILVYTSENLQVGQILQVKLYYYLESCLNTLQATAEVLGSDRLQKRGAEFGYAMQFIEISTAERENLRKFLKSIYL